MTHHVTWHQRGGRPKEPPNPAFPKGVDLDLTNGAKIACLVNLPYPPARKRLGLLTVRCDACGRTVAITTAGRPDDPRSVKLACNLQPEKP